MQSVLTNQGKHAFSTNQKQKHVAGAFPFCARAIFALRSYWFNALLAFASLRDCSESLEGSAETFFSIP